MKSSLTNVNWIKKGIGLLQDLKGGLAPEGNLGRVVHARWGATMVLNDFRVIIGETAKTVVLMSLPNEDVTGDGWQGTEKPTLAFDALSTASHV